MPFDWARQGDRSAGRLTIKSMGAVGGNAPGSIKIVTNNATVTFVDQMRMQATISEQANGLNVSVTRTAARLVTPMSCPGAPTTPPRPGFRRRRISS